MFMFGIIKMNIIKKQGSYLELLDLHEHRSLEKLKSIVSTFELDKILLKCAIRVPVNSELLTLSNTIESVTTNIKKTKKYLFSKKMYSDADIVFYGDNLLKILDIVAKEDEALYIVPKDKKNKDIEMILNNNDHNYINFSMKKYDAREIKRKVKIILKQYK